MSTPIRTSPANDHRRQPRKKRAPSARDQAIVLAYRTRGCSQEELAHDNRLSQRRISQIVQRVERWLADRHPAAENQLDHAQRQRLERELERERLQAIYSRSIRDYDRAPTELKTKRAGQRGDHKFQEETTRTVLPNVQLLKTALRASEDLGQLADREPPARLSDPEWEARERRNIMHTELCNLRHEAEEKGQVVRGKAEEQAPVWTVDWWLDALVGNRNNRPDPKNTLPGTPLAELAEFCSPRRVGVPPVELEEDEPADDAYESADPDLSNLSNLTADEQPASEEQPASAEPRRESGSPFPSLEDETISSFASRILHDKSLTPAQRTAAISEFKKRDQRRRLRVNTLVLDGVPPALAERTERRIAHDEKLEQLREARRRGLPCMLTFDPADGPLPPRYSSPNDFGYEPSPPPTSEEIRQRHKEYLAKLRAQNEANRRS